MKEPSVNYLIEGFQERKQKPHECQANRMCTLFEKHLFLSYGLRAKFDAADIDNKIRKHLKQEEGKGVSTWHTLYYMKRYGFYDHNSKGILKIKDFSSQQKDPDDVRKSLIFFGPIAFSRYNTVGGRHKTFREKGGYIYEPGEKLANSSHAITLMGWDAGLGMFWYIEPSKGKRPVYITEESFKKVYKRIYSITV